MSSLVIVAIPTEDDYVNKISSEKIPHMTLLFLGEDAEKVKNFNNILGFTQHAANQSLMRFGLEVDRRGVLGDDSADVLFFSKSKWSGFEQINNFRSYLLKNDNIRTAYDATEQFPEWIPHLTLGTPDSPAKPDERDYPGINYVNFDRIAVWFGDFEGIEFRLKAYDWDTDVAMGNVTAKQVVDDILEHHGVKGQKWGIRRFRESRAERKFVSQVKQPRKNINLHIRLHNATGDAMNNVHIPRINSKPEYVKAANEGRLRNEWDPVTQKYTAEYMQAYEDELNKEAAKLGTSPSGQQYYAKLNDDFLGFSVGLKKVKHADSESFKIEFVKDKQGRIIGFKLVEDSLTQSALIVNDFLAHHGVKGMRWGIRRDRSSGPQDVTIRRSKFPGSTRLKAKGGRGHPSTESGLSARRIGQVGKKSGMHALTDEQLREYQNRIQLEQNVSRLMYNEKSRGSQFVDQFLGRQGSRLANEAARAGAAKGGKLALKKAAKRSVRVAKVTAAVAAA